MALTRLVLWRHGQTSYNLAGRYQGQVDTALTDTGHEQARAAAAHIAHALTSGRPASGPGGTPDAPERYVAIVSSDLGRASDTAAELAGMLGCSVTLDEGLRETAYGRWEGLTRDEVQEQFPGDLATWKSGADVAVHGGETRAESAARVVAAIERAAGEVPAGISTLVVVSHGGALRGAAEVLLGLPGSGALGVLGNAGWGVLEPRRDGGWLLAAWNRE